MFQKTSWDSWGLVLLTLHYFVTRLGLSLKKRAKRNNHYRYFKEAGCVQRKIIMLGKVLLGQVWCIAPPTKVTVFFHPFYGVGSTSKVGGPKIKKGF